MIYRNIARTLGTTASRINGSNRPFHTISPVLIGVKQTQFPILGNLDYAKKPSPFAMSLRNYIHSGNPVQSEIGNTGSHNIIKELLDENPGPISGRRFGFAPLSFHENRNFGYGRSSQYQSNLETNADIVHIKLMRNNAFVTVTDSKGNKKAGISTGKLAGKGMKTMRYSAEAAAENMGRAVRKMETKSVVVKVNGFTFFRKKKDAILSFKDGYTNSRAEGNPIVFIEDTTRKPHNGCRLKKQRRI